MPWRRTALAHIARSLAHAVDAKGGYMPGHSDGVAYLVGTMASELGMGPTDVSHLSLAAMVHDVGKLYVPDEILLAERRLTEDEFALVKPHSIWGETIVRNLRGMEFATSWVRHHHERFDGGGYPDGLVGEQIPFEARLLAVADAFHVITTDRPYQVARTRGEAVSILMEMAGSQFCPDAVSLLLDRERRPRNRRFARSD